MAEFLLECYSEEMPAGAQRPAAEALQKLIEDGYHAAGIISGVFSCFVTPKRLVILGEKLPAETPATTEEKRGPRVGAPEKAVAGFADSCNASVASLEIRETAKGAFYFYENRKPSQPTASITGKIVEDALRKLVWPKSMYWGTSDIQWIRPLKSILCLFDGNVAAAKFGSLIASDRAYVGLPTDEKEAKVASFADYRDFLLNHGVIIDDAERLRDIIAGAEAAARDCGGALRSNLALAKENAGLAEAPRVLSGKFDEKFLELPPETLTASMRSHQKYFCVEDGDKKLLPSFVFVANDVAPDKQQKVIDGNERVLRARLQDALYFRRRDMSRPLESRAKDLEKVVFHAELGSLYDKVQRLRSLAKLIAVWVPGANLIHVERAAALCKCDLLTQTVIEFTDLQGVIGKDYALADLFYRQAPARRWPASADRANAVLPANSVRR